MSPAPDLCPCGLMPADAAFRGACSPQCESEIEERDAAAELARLREASAECAA